MPTSDPFNINAIVKIIVSLKPGRVLDVGCGFGKYGVLLREYLDIWDERLERDQWRTHIEGIEACERYQNPIHDYAYNQVHYGEAQTVLGQTGEFDVILIADVIEHLTKEDSTALVRDCFAHAPVVVISTPREFYEQHAICDNPYEVHRYHFGRADFPPEVHVRVVRAMSCDIFVASREPLNPDVFQLTEPADFIYIHSRRRLGLAGLPISLSLRSLCRLFG